VTTNRWTSLVNVVGALTIQGGPLTIYGLGTYQSIPWSSTRNPPKIERTLTIIIIIIIIVMNRT
jgi:hypothetical protein